MLIKRIFWLFILLIPEMVTGQDAQFSQFYAAPLYLNPAFTGSSQLTRVGANYRNQWPSLESNFVTFTAWADHFIDEKNSGIGFSVMRDQANISKLQTTSINGTYAYQLPVTQTFTVRAGVDVGYVIRDIDYASLVFGDQINPDGSINPGTGESFNTGERKNFFDLGAGVLLYSESAWIGYSAKHLTQPNQSLIGEASPLPIRHSFHLGYKFFFKSGTVGQGLFSRPQERSVAPVVQYKFQGQFDQLDLGVYFTYDPILLGLWYRGVPLKQVDGIVNNDAVVLLVGFNKSTSKEIFNIGYSYDITISNLGARSGGAHEFSISYAWFTGNPRKPPKNVRLIPCPNF